MGFGFSRYPHAFLVPVAFAAAFAAALAGLPRQATAQQADPARETTRPGAETRSTVRGRDAQRESERTGLLDGRDVRYGEVLARPDDIALNFEWAKTQIRKGDLLGASATLERILLRAPNLPRVRVLYAIVLYRLDNYDDAERELENVLRLEMPVSLRRQLAKYLADARLRKKATRMSLLLNQSYYFDTNRTALPASGQVDTFLGRFSVADTGKSDHGFQSIVRFAIEHDLGFQRRHRLIADITAYAAEQIRLDRYDLQATILRAGAVFDFAPYEIAPMLTWRYLRLSHEDFLNAPGFRVDAAFDASRDLRLFARFALEAQSFREIDESGVNAQRTGPEYRFDVGARFTLGPRMQLVTLAGFIRKTATGFFNEYSSIRLAVDHTWLLGDGMYLLSHVSLRQDWYDDPDPFVSVQARRDKTIRLRLTFGVPILTLAGQETALPIWLGDTTLSVGAEYTRVFSTITNYAYGNFRFIAGLTTRFDW